MTETISDCYLNFKKDTAKFPNFDKMTDKLTCGALKTHQNFFHHNLNKSDPILISFGTNIPDTTGYQTTV